MYILLTVSSSHFIVHKHYCYKKQHKNNDNRLGFNLKIVV